MKTVVTDVECKSILNRSRIPPVDYSINPYLGCGHGCRYCYAVFMKKFAAEDGPWGSFVRAKVNAPAVLARQLRRAGDGLVTLSTVTDPYQPAERRYQLTRRCLIELAGSGLEVSVLTKSDLVLRDIDVLKDCGVREVRFTITTLDEGAVRAFEPGAPSVRRRLAALEELNSRGITTGVFIGPVLPFFSDSVEALGSLFRGIEEAGTTEVLLDSINLGKKDVRANVMGLVREAYPELVERFNGIIGGHSAYRQELRRTALAAASGLSVNVSFCF